MLVKKRKRIRKKKWKWLPIRERERETRRFIGKMKFFSLAKTIANSITYRLYLFLLIYDRARYSDEYETGMIPRQGRLTFGRQSLEEIGERFRLKSVIACNKRMRPIVSNHGCSRLDESIHVLWLHRLSSLITRENWYFTRYVGTIVSTILNH